MKVYTTPDKQAAKAVSKASAIGESRHDNKGGDDFKIRSLSTAETYKEVLTQVATWLREQGIQRGLQSISVTEAKQYLAERSEDLGQSSLDKHRNAIQCVIVQKLERVTTEKVAVLANQSRAYSADQARAILNSQNDRNAISTAIAFASGLRAHELLTIRPVSEQPASSHRTWSADRFTGRDGVRYSVIGKGGLTREIQLPQGLADRLEARKLDAPVQVTDRKIHYTQHYDVAGGKNWSDNFTSHSKAQLEFTNGGHGLRHGYAQTRMSELQERGASYRQSLTIVSQELGHFRASITETYLR